MLSLHPAKKCLVGIHKPFLMKANVFFAKQATNLSVFLTLWWQSVFSFVANEWFLSISWSNNNPSLLQFSSLQWWAALNCQFASRNSKITAIKCSCTLTAVCSFCGWICMVSMRKSIETKKQLLWWQSGNGFTNEVDHCKGPQAVSKMMSQHLSFLNFCHCLKARDCFQECLIVGCASTSHHCFDGNWTSMWSASTFCNICVTRWLLEKINNSHNHWWKIAWLENVKKLLQVRSFCFSLRRSFQAFETPPQMPRWSAFFAG